MKTNIAPLPTNPKRIKTNTPDSILAATIPAEFAESADTAPHFLGLVDRLVPEERIVGGQPVPIANVPWIVSLTAMSRHLCGASIITANRILTAAHCTDDVRLIMLGVRAGSSAINQGGQVIRASRIVNHPQYNARTIQNDIGLVWLQSALTRAPGVAPIRLPAQGAATATGAMATVAGWGHTTFNGTNSQTLRSVQVPIVAQNVCNLNYRGVIRPSQICAGFPQGGRDACQNDSGGPLSLNGDLIGVVSFGFECARPNRPGVYARVSYYRNWIKQNV